MPCAHAVSLRRIGLFGGTFDPPHWGHIRLAKAAADELRLDQLLFLPAYQPPHKKDEIHTPFELRRQMLELCLPYDLRFSLCLIEAEQNLPGTTLETVQRLREKDHAKSCCRLFWLMGSDSLLELPTWHKPEELLSAVEMAVLPRPGFPIEKAESRFLKRVRILQTPLIDVAAHDIRARSRDLRESVPPPVADFIIRQGLYNFTPETAYS
ncbi:MAG: nicotinate (nicotinamide) nucleotide adenylyltransferase [bacterium]